MANSFVKQIACIGGGNWGKNLIRNFNDLGALSWVCEVDANTWDQLRSKYPTIGFTDKVDQALSNPDMAGVTIATPAATHGERLCG